MVDIHVRHEEDDRFLVRIGAHELVVDQPDTGDAGPTPTDLFVASLASCVAFYAERFLARHDVPVAGLAVDCSYSMATDRPARVSAIEVTLVVPAACPERLLDRLHAVVEHCTVHNSLLAPPDVRIDLRASASVG